MHLYVITFYVRKQNPVMEYISIKFKVNCEVSKKITTDEFETILPSPKQLN